MWLRFGATLLDALALALFTPARRLVQKPFWDFLEINFDCRKMPIFFHFHEGFLVAAPPR
jgi:hypothetical protein